MFEEEPPLAKATLRMDDGGSDLTDRFKYKVNALMGKYDPPPSAAASTGDGEGGEGGGDTERDGQGNILNAMLKFPTRYAFHAVGRIGDRGGEGPTGTPRASPTRSAASPAAARTAWTA